jgi:flagellar biosynthesis/type III secretory pathway M-ring protein FliF/YscJ
MSKDLYFLVLYITIIIAAIVGSVVLVLNGDFESLASGAIIVFFGLVLFIGIPELIQKREDRKSEKAGRLREENQKRQDNFERLAKELLKDDIQNKKS